jgi:peptidoglycan hydrolase-like protein with peptidoglycan-binding domain
MCNYYEKWQTKKYSNPYDCTMKSGWYGNESKNKNWIKNNPNVPQTTINAVKDVIVNGNRNIPDYVDEYDCLSDIASISNNGTKYTGSNVKKRSLYIKDVTKITNVYGSNYTFYCFPDGTNGYCDAFGYISKPATTTTTTTQQKTNTNTTTVPDAACSWAESIAADQSHGYSQQSRWGPDYDCSSLVISSYIKAGVPIDKNKVYYTGNMNGLKNYGFVDVTKNVNLDTGAGLLRGDILYYHISGTNGHTAMYCGNGKIVHARGQSYGSPSTGDQGTEIAVTNYSRSKWQYVLRYSKNTTVTVTSATTSTTTVTTQTLYQRGSVGTKVKEIQQQLNKVGNYGLEEDGEFGRLTEQAVIDFQSKNGLEVDGIVGKQTLNKLAELVKKNPESKVNINTTNTATNSGPSKTVKYKGTVTAMYLNVRSGPGLEYENIKSYPILSKNTVI